jgi:hypothetical protein
MSKNAKQFGMAMIAVMALLAIQPNAGADSKESEKTKEAHRSGGGVGNGGEASRKAYIKKLKDELGELQLRKSTQTEEITGWSSKVANMLKTEMERAERRISKQNDLDAAKQIMQDALAVAGDSLELEPELAKPITKTLIDRGLMILIALDDTLDVSKKFDLKTEVNFLFDYMGFIIKKEKELDRDWYIPYRYKYYDRCRDRCEKEFDYDAFERKYIRYAQEQIEFVLDHLAEIKKDRDGEEVPVPVGNAKAFLRVAELVTDFASEDISENLHANNYTCVIDELSALSTELMSYNLFDDRSYFSDDADAVYISYWKMARAAREISIENDSWKKLEKR